MSNYSTICIKGKKRTCNWICYLGWAIALLHEGNMVIFPYKCQYSHRVLCFRHFQVRNPTCFRYKILLAWVPFFCPPLSLLRVLLYYPYFISIFQVFAGVFGEEILAIWGDKSNVHEYHIPALLFSSPYPLSSWYFIFGLEAVRRVFKQQILWFEDPDWRQNWKKKTTRSRKKKAKTDWIFC